MELMLSFFFFFNDTATTEIYTLSLHDALPIWKIGLGALQLAMDAQADAEVPLPGLTGADGERRGCRGRAARPGGARLGGVGGGPAGPRRREEGGVGRPPAGRGGGRGPPRGCLDAQ